MLAGFSKLVGFRDLLDLVDNELQSQLVVLTKVSFFDTCYILYALFKMNSRPAPTTVALCHIQTNFRQSYATVDAAPSTALSLNVSPVITSL